MATLASITLITLSGRGTLRGPLRETRKLGGDAFSPVQHAVGDVLRPLGSFLGGAVHGPALERQNAQLRAQLQRERAAQAASQALQEQLAGLEQAAGVPGVGTTPAVEAQVIGNSVSDFADTITIDRGTADGVDVGMPVVGGGSGGGLVGAVVEPVSAHNATVELVTDIRFSVDVRLPDGTPALVAGRGRGNPLAVENVVPGTQLSRGAVLGTAGLGGGRFPIGIPVCSVTSFTASATANTEDVTAQPVLRFSTLEYVAVLQWPPPSGP